MPGVVAGRDADVSNSFKLRCSAHLHLVEVEEVGTGGGDRQGGGLSSGGGKAQGFGGANCVFVGNSCLGLAARAPTPCFLVAPGTLC